MYLKSIVLEGFKSYGQRTEIRGFDPEFNAITGLNGSGKSNILDAICFVLGITNLSHVRAGSMQELVYKNGQAGVTKASVTITFDNNDPVGRPCGYESHNEITVTRQVVIGGKNKYLLNGTNVQNKRIQDLFCSVQMNVNNPHFLIMQGRITKVLNMKPPEILSMIEEAAGTRMYEAKRQLAQKTIEKKDAKLTQLNEVVDDEIRPKLNKLREEKGQYLEYQKVIRELETSTRLYVAYQYITLQETSEMTLGSLRRMQANIETTKKCIDDDQKELIDIERRVVDMHKKRDEETGGVLEELDEQLKVKDKSLAQVSSLLKATTESITSETKKKKQLEKNLKEEESALKVKESEHDKVGGLFQGLKDADKADADALAAAQRKYQAVSSGLLANEDGAQETLQGQLMKSRESAAQALADMKQAQMQLQHSQKELKTKEKDMNTTSGDFQKDKRNLDNLEKEVKSIQDQMSKLTYEEGSLEMQQGRKNQLSTEIRSSRETIDRIEARYSQLRFQYADPEPKFNRASVRGLVCNLFKVKDPSMAVALQTVAGGRLYNVIVDTEVVGKMILKNGQLKQRINVIPLNKISGKSIDARVVKAAADLVGKENAQPALSLIEYSPDVHSAMVFVFGQAFVCRDMPTASKVAFDKRISKKCVTLDGDVSDPGGTLSGGAAVKGQPILQIVQELSQHKETFQAKTRELAEVEKILKNLSGAATTYARLKETYDLRKHELDMVRTRLQQTEHHQHQEEVDALKTQIIELGKRVTDCKKIAADGEKRAKELEKKMVNAKEIQERELQEAEQETAKLKKKAATSRANWMQREQEYEALKMEITELQTSIETGKAQIAAADKALEELAVQVSEQQIIVNEAKGEVQDIQAQIKEKKEIISQKNKEITQLNHRKDKLTKECADLGLEIKKGEIECSKMDSEYKDSLRKVDKLADEYTWVETDKQFFGQQGIYNFKDHDMPSVGKRLVELVDKKDKLSRTVNTRAMNMLEQQEDECGDLINKKQIVENDKSKIMLVIKELDEKKKVALRTACEQVNKDFGSIFSSLLPGAQARLQPPDGKDVLDGLEVKVGFSGVWKDSLGELSGGQRSLVALSLILAMLLFKPAPIYILDEVDAALDLSHTQNIGNMLKTHFKDSQFIVVSLKDGMFNNANVLFRTAFIDGMSTVSRTVQKQSSNTAGSSHRRN